jgi:predicted PurR-regulated permease PerM
MNISTRTILKVLTLITAFIALVYCVYLTRTVLTWIVASCAFALALNPAVVWVQRHIPRHNRTLATLTVFLALFLVTLLLAVTLLPPVVSQTKELILNLPTYTNQIIKPGTLVGDSVTKYDLISKIQASQNELISRLTNASGTFVGLVTGFFSSVVALISIFGLTFFILMEGPEWLAVYWKARPEKERAHGKWLANEMYQAMVGYVNGKILAAFLAGLSAAIMLTILNVPYSAALALVVALLSIIPLFGATLGAAIVVAVCLFSSPASALIMAIFFFTYQQVENNLIQPYIFKKTVDVSPLLVFVSVLIGTATAGILGALIAIPVTASIQILVRDYYSRHIPKATTTKSAA